MHKAAHDLDVPIVAWGHNAVHSSSNKVANCPIKPEGDGDLATAAVAADCPIKPEGDEDLTTTAVAADCRMKAEGDGDMAATGDW